MSDWINIKKELPPFTHKTSFGTETSDRVLIVLINGEISLAYLHILQSALDPRWIGCECMNEDCECGNRDWKVNEVSYWMPLPEVPKHDKE